LELSPVGVTGRKTGGPDGGSTNCNPYEESDKGVSATAGDPVPPTDFDPKESSLARWLQSMMMTGLKKRWRKTDDGTTIFRQTTMRMMMMEDDGCVLRRGDYVFSANNSNPRNCSFSGGERVSLPSSSVARCRKVVTHTHTNRA
jgi:hypothetical protein